MRVHLMRFPHGSPARFVESQSRSSTDINRPSHNGQVIVQVDARANLPEVGAFGMNVIDLIAARAVTRRMIGRKIAHKRHDKQVFFVRQLRTHLKKKRPIACVSITV